MHILHLRVVCRNVCLVSDNVVSGECYVLDKAALCIQQKSDESALCHLCVQQNDVEKEINYVEEFRLHYAMFVNCNS